MILTLLGAYTFVKAINYYNVANDVVLLETFAFRKYLKIYDLTENKAPRNVSALKEYIKMKDLLYNKIKAIDINYLKKEGEKSCNNYYYYLYCIIHFTKFIILGHCP